MPIPAAAEHPARRWLAARHLWRPEMHLPPSVRWMPSEGGPAAGAVVAAFAAPCAGRVSAVHLVHVDGDGLPAPDRTGPDRLPKRSYGAMSGAVCVLGLVDAAGGVQVCEGLADGLALAARDPWPAGWRASAPSRCGATATALASVRRVTRHRIPDSIGRDSEEVPGSTDQPYGESQGGQQHVGKAVTV